jgi:CRP-like cAMP-binding protein
MFAIGEDNLRPLTAKLERLAGLDQEDRKAIQNLPMSVKPARPNSYLVREGGTASACCLLVDGYACRHKTASNGERQIVSFQLPGDILDLQHLWLEQADHNIQTITEAVIGWIPVAELQALIRDRPRIGEALWRDTLIDASIFREWVLNVGRRNAKQRIAHMLCEFAVRREAAGLGPPESFVMPMTQEHIADATGLTAIHVNRMLQALGAEGVIQREKRHIAIADWDRMRRVADFQPAYLHIAEAEAA